jgi:prepilin-type N-terminal cleavage/methylation domain-containing protein
MSTNLHKKGLSLIELMVVMAIIGILASALMVNVNNTRSKGRDAKRVSDFNQVRNALELFRETYGVYPVTASTATWEGNWQNLAICLETGVGCGISTPGYVPVLRSVPQDPMDNPNTVSDSDPTYYYGIPHGCSTGSAYRIAAYLENNNPALRGDLEGFFYNNLYPCADNVYGYCLGSGSCTGW